MRLHAMFLLSLLCFAAPAVAQDSKSSDSGTMARADADMRDVLLKLDELNPAPLGTVPPEEARKQPTPADAVAALLKSQGKDPEQLKQQSGVATENLTYPGADGSQIAARLYRPQGVAQNAPVILYIHGGGWVIADLDTYDATPRALAKKAGAIVVSVHYRQAPEHKFPAAHEDTIAAYKWVLDNAAGWGGDPRRIAIVGESAGGNMALNVAIAARELKLQMPLHVTAVYPVARTNLDSPSYIENANAKPLGLEGMRWFFRHLTDLEQDLSDARLNLASAGKLEGLPPVTVITAAIDPLRSDGEALAERLKAAGVEVSFENYDGVTHEFFGMDAVVKRAQEAQDFVVKRLTEDLMTTSSVQ